MELHFLAQLLITQASQEDLPAQPETVNNGEMSGVVLFSLAAYLVTDLYDLVPKGAQNGVWIFDCQ